MTLAIERVAQASGFFYEGTMRKANFVRGKHIDVQLFSLLREESVPLDDLTN
jgi:RimJ/RimL family protein N-acetyltransferase